MQWLALLLRIWGNGDSNLGPEVGDLHISWFLSVLFCYNISRGHKISFYHLPITQFNDHPTIRRNINL
jgi:hypothetical protein